MTTINLSNFLDNTYVGFTGSQGPSNIPVNSQSTSYVLQSTDTGKFVDITTGGVTIPTAVFSVGDVITIYNNSTSTQTITQGASTTVYLAGTSSTGNRTIAQRGLSTILCVDSNTFVISGAGVY